MANNEKIWLSHSGVDILYRCPRCFWLRYNRKIYQPEGIVSRLPSRFDIVIKRYFDKFREQGQLPPIVEGKIEGVLQNPFQEKYFYPLNEKYGFWGKLDDCLIDESQSHIPIDFKTTSSDPNLREPYPAYQNQLDEYGLLLEANGKKTAGLGHLIFFYPQESEELHIGFPMSVRVQTLKINPGQALNRVKEATEVLDGPLPESSPDCPFCRWLDIIGKSLDELK